MLNAIRGKHSKKVLWLIAGAVIMAFVLSNASSFLDRKQAKIIAEIGGQKVTITNFNKYIDLARLDFILYRNENDRAKEITSDAIIEKAKIYYRLLWKAKEEGVEVGDKETVQWINRNFSRSGKFDQASYQQYIEYISRNFGLTLTMRSFEEYIRQLIVIDRLWEKLIKVSVTDEEVQSLYAIENQKAKIAYFFIPYEKFRVDVGIQPNEIEDFYHNNKTSFQKESTVDIEYVLIAKDDDSEMEKANELSKFKTLKEFAEKELLEIEETGFIKKNDIAKETGWKQEVAQIAFNLGISEMSSPIDVDESLMIVSKKDEKASFIPPLGEIEAEVKEKLIVFRAKEETKEFATDLLKEINQKKITNLAKFKNKNNGELKETDFFKYNDYIEGIGLDKNISSIIFSLKKDEIHSDIIALDKGACILQLKDKTPIDEVDFQAKEKEYHDKIEERKLFFERIKLVTKLNKEIIINLPSIK